MFKFVAHLTRSISDFFSGNRFTSSEHANNVNTMLDKIVDAFMGAWNFFDNNYMSFYKNVQRFTEGVPQGEELALFIPLLLVGAIIYFFVEVWYHYLHRDAWDAYWTREAEKLRHIKSLLETLQNTPNSKEKTARLNQIAAYIKTYEEDTEPCHVDKNDLNGTAALAEVKAELSELKNQLITNYHIDRDEVKIVDGTSQLISPKISSRSSLRTLTDSDGENNKATQFIKLEPAPAAPKTLKDDLLSFTNSSGFTTVFAFAWGYWFVYYFAIWGVPAAAAFVAVPPLFALIALVCPVAYLIYKEYKAYQATMLVEETLTEAEKGQLAGMESKEKNQFLRNKTSDTRQFRYGWGFVALIAGLAFFMFLQPLISLPLAILAGVGVMVGVGLLMKGITGFLDKRAEFRREEFPITQSSPSEFQASTLHDENGSLILLEEETISTTPLSENRDRKKWAMWRKRQLKAAEQATYQLMELAKLEAALRQFGVGKIDTLLYNPDNNDENHEEIEVVPTPKQTIAEKIKAVMNKGSIDGEAEKKRTHQIRLAYAHMVLGIILDIFTGYMLMCLIGFALGDFLSPISNLLGFAGSLLEQVFFNVTVGGLGLLCAGSKAYVTYQDQSKKIADLEKSFEQESAYKEKNNEVLALIKLSNDKREALNTQLKNLINTYPAHQVNLESLQKLLIKPKKPSTLTLHKFVKRLREVMSALTSIASVILIARSVVTMGILGGAFTTLLLNGSLIVFGATVMTANPLGIAILSIAAALMVARLVRELYLQVKTERNLKKTEELDLKYARKMAEYERLEMAEKGIEELNQNLLKHPSSPAGSNDSITLKKNSLDRNAATPEVMIHYSDSKESEQLILSKNKS